MLNLLRKVGLNVQEGQPVLVLVLVRVHVIFVAKVVEACYELGSKRVSVEWLTKINKIRFKISK